ncbi:hypothetical protein [Pedobacter endophyticus]|uniref:Response regulatory domain-containing protein n=1 Tax=Pedobacter endophyticus TaxID=2789740 RepID=A0A7U3Q4S4_9SPHI|nr:hypothetical protein [Pedobacter endophyticus]QPH38593.1 hypothetical protein IZT61_16110 [Pedobacter endophyticus]
MKFETMIKPNIPIARCLIVDADCFAANKVEKCLVALPWIRLLGIVSDAGGARAVLSENQSLDVIFFGTGVNNAHAFEIAAALRDHVTCMVFIGDNNESALKAFQVGGDHFVQRRLLVSDFTKTLGELIIKKLDSAEKINVSNGNLWIPLQTGNSTNQFL